MSDGPSNLIDAARWYLARGYAPIPVPAGTKVPVLKGWTDLRLSDAELPQHFNGTGNIGVLLGDLRVLAEVSVPVPMALSTDAGHVTGNQRAINEAHVQGIVKYLQNGTARFLPEIVLSVRLEDDIIDAFRNHKKLPAQAGRPITVFEAPGITVVSPKAVALEEIRASARIRRIDGNHRLTAAERLEKGAVQPANKYLASFCVVLLGPVGEEAYHRGELVLVQSPDKTLLFRTRDITGDELDAITQQIDSRVDEKANRFEKFVQVIEAGASPDSVLKAEFGGVESVANPAGRSGLSATNL